MCNLVVFSGWSRQFNDRVLASALSPLIKIAVGDINTAALLVTYRSSKLLSHLRVLLSSPLFPHTSLRFSRCALFFTYLFLSKLRRDCNAEETLQGVPQRC
jgi:hypothetical protein